MDFKNKLKNFWRLNAQSAKGFTLVELIVVIAILAILACIAVPAYSGYVEKANKAADEQLLANVNQAFAAACASNGEDHFSQNPNTTKISLTDADSDGDREVIVLENDNAAIVSSFGDFFEGGEFKVFKELYYNGELGMFKDLNSNIFNQIFSSLDLTDEQEKLMASIFGNIGTEELMEKIDIVTALVANGGDAFVAMLVGTDGANIDAMAKSMGYTGMTDEKFAAAYSEMLATKMAEGMTEDEATNYILANYAVLQAAKTTMDSNKTTTEWLTALQSEDYVTMTKNLMNQSDAGAQQEGMSQAAMMYAMYTAYANGLEEGETKTEALENVQDISKFVNAMGADEGFSQYLKNVDGQAAKDLDGYVAAMSIIDKSVENNGDAVSDLLVNGYSNAELLAGLNGLLSE